MIEFTNDVTYNMNYTRDDVIHNNNNSNNKKIRTSLGDNIEM